VAPVDADLRSEFVRFFERLQLAVPTILVIGTLDTKADDIECVADEIVDLGGHPVLLDSSVSVGDSETEYPLVDRARVAHAAGRTIESIGSLPRGEAVDAMRAGVRELVECLVSAERAHGAICIGGAGAHLAGPAFQALPIGFPKLVVSPLASGRRQFEPFVGLRDVAVMHSVVDIAGVNQITRRVYRSAAGYIVGAAQAYATSDNGVELGEGAPTIAISMNGNTTPAMSRARGILEEAGFGAVAFHANGVGGRALEDFIASDSPAGVLDYTTTELGARTVGGLMDAGPERMETAGKRGIPQVLVPGCLDFVTCGPWDETEREFPGRTMFRHNPELTLVRLGRTEMAELGAVFAEKANAAAGPTAVFVPTRGFSVPDSEGGPFWDPEADAAFLQTLEANLSDGVSLQVVDAHVNDSTFVDLVVAELLGLMGCDGPGKNGQRLHSLPEAAAE
jgi:uncharacterized protein (UPF0261 family)